MQIGCYPTTWKGNCGLYSKNTLQGVETIQVEDTSSFEGVQNYLGTVEGLLLDTYHKDMHGGTGVEFDWSCIPFTLFKQSKMILAGGLRPENIHEAINKVQPNVIDVNSGIEVHGYKTMEE